MAANANPGSNVWTTAAGVNKYGAPPNNSNRQALNHNNAISTQDYTGRANTTPNAANDVVSPTATLTANAIQLVIPPNACTLTLVSTATFSFSEYGTAGSPLTQSVAWPGNTPVTLDVARQQYLYVTGTTALSFFFQTL